MGPPDAPLVVVVGDSMVKQAAPEITAELVAAGFDVAIYGENGLDTPAGFGLILQGAERQPVSVVVMTTVGDAVELFVNGRGEGGRTSDEVRAPLNAAFDVLDHVPCSTWMLIDEHVVYYGLSVTGPVVNGMVSGMAERWRR